MAKIKITQVKSTIDLGVLLAEVKIQKLVPTLILSLKRNFQVI